MQKKEKIVYRVARTRDELAQAFALVYKEYAQRGYIPKGYKSKMRLSLYNALPSTATFVGMQGTKVVAAVTLIPDTAMGIPMDKIYNDELAPFRKKGLRIAEVSQLSIDSKLFPPGWFSMFNFEKLMFVFKLFKLVFDYARSEDRLDELCIAVNPKHQYLYKFLFFKQFGKLKYYGSVNKAPALALHLSINKNLETKSQLCRKVLYNIFYGSRVNRNLIKNKFVLRKADLEYFFVKESDLFEKATKEQLDVIRKYYPKEEFDKIIKC
jgi:hypothetical protein